MRDTNLPPASVPDDLGVAQPPQLVCPPASPLEAIGLFIIDIGGGTFAGGFLGGAAFMFLDEITSRTVNCMNGAFDSIGGSILGCIVGCAIGCRFFKKHLNCE